MNEDTKLQIAQSLSASALRNINLARQLLIESKQLGMTHAQRNGVELVLESLLNRAANELKSVFYQVGEASGKSLDDIPF